VADSFQEESITVSTSLSDFSKKHDFYVGIDSDGCVFDSMEIKHKECFCPAFVDHYELQAVSKYAREVWEFVNLYSTTRGINRFKAVLKALSLVEEHPEAKRRGVTPPKLPNLSAWVERENKLGNPALQEEIDRTGNEELKRVMAWSLDVNAAVEKIVRGVPPFPFVRAALAKMQDDCDVVVVSQTPLEALEREWEEQNIDSMAALICGQEMGTKGEHLKATAGGKYEPSRILMIGDAPGDLKAAEAVGACFFPVIPGREEESWERLLNEGLETFLREQYVGSYQEGLLNDFRSALPEHPPWTGA
jgi:phosphoglycolate phosphatase-like HAD superfamily hydrolase